MWWATWSIVGLLLAAPTPPGARTAPEVVGEPAAADREDPNAPDPRAMPTIPAKVQVQNQMGKRFRLVEATVLLDGLEVSRRKAAAGQELERSFSGYEGAIGPGNHTLAVELVYEGRNLGPFTYLDDYRFSVATSYPFTARVSDRPASLDVVARERPGATVPVEQKPVLDIAPAAGSGATPMLPPATPPAAGKSTGR
jgi:hypothetical protein